MNQCINLEATKKRVQFATLFQLLANGHPKLEFKSHESLYKLFGVLDLSTTHWCDSSGWTMAAYINKKVVEETKIAKVRYIDVIVDEITTMDNSSLLSIHAYTMQNWIYIPLLISLQQVECLPNVKNLTQLIVTTISDDEALDVEFVDQKISEFWYRWGLHPIRRTLWSHPPSKGETCTLFYWYPLCGLSL